MHDGFCCRLWLTAGSHAAVARLGAPDRQLPDNIPNLLEQIWRPWPRRHCSVGFLWAGAPCSTRACRLECYQARTIWCDWAMAWVAERVRTLTMWRGANKLVSAGVLALATILVGHRGAAAVDVSPFEKLAGRWVGEGRLGVRDNPPENVKCRVTYILAGGQDQLKQT